MEAGSHLGQQQQQGLCLRDSVTSQYSIELDDGNVHCKLPLLYRAHTIGAHCPVFQTFVLFSSSTAVVGARSCT